ncbi:aquaporin-4-like [Haliotis rubra]|uniref:aquaporin-4-like n=1 Tax=Haliotis rubra TaxID=36100 RepID=UPI001EE5E8B4|nr:aquaporin-4-like [Haliotis rubra]
MSFAQIMDNLFHTVRSVSFWRSVKTEFLLTTFYVLFGCGATITANTRCKASTDELKAAVTFGMTTVTLLHCSLRMGSPAQMNPAITIAMLCTRKIDIITAFFNVFAQCLGGIAGAGVLYGVTPARQHEYLGVTSVHSDIESGQAFGIEFLITFVLVFAYFSSMDPPHLATGTFQVIPAGLAIAIGHTFGWKYTGASLNPARSLGPAIVCNEWRDHWVYWVGPILGALLGGITFEYSHINYTGSRLLRRSSSTRDESGLEARASSKESVDLPTELTFSVNMPDDPEV